jgi:hypothetical protein
MTIKTVSQGRSPERSPAEFPVSMQATATEISAETRRGPVNITFWPRDWDAPHGPKGGSTATFTLDDDIEGTPVLAKAEADAMCTLLGLVLPDILACNEGTTPAAWTPDPYACCTLCPCSPGLVADEHIIINGQVADLEITPEEPSDPERHPGRLGSTRPGSPVPTRAGTSSCRGAPAVHERGVPGLRAVPRRAHGNDCGLEMVIADEAHATISAGLGSIEAPATKRGNVEWNTVPVVLDCQFPDIAESDLRLFDTSCPEGLLVALPVVPERILLRVQYAVEVNICNNDQAHTLGGKAVAFDLESELLNILAPVFRHLPCLRNEGVEGINEIFREVVVECRALRLCSNSRG